MRFHVRDSLNAIGAIEPIGATVRPASEPVGRTNWLLAAGLAATVLIGGSPALAQQLPDPDERPPDSTNLPLRFGFSPPGARAVGMGGSFIGIADDATAAEANPAGLVNLSRPEASIHYRSTSYDIEYFDGQGQDLLNFANTIRTDAGAPALAPGARIGSAFASNPRTNLEGDVDDVSFASYVHPFGGMTFSVYYQQDASFEGENTSPFQVYDDTFGDLYSTSQSISLDIESFGAALAFRIGDRFSLGASVRYTEGQIALLQRQEIEYFLDTEFLLFDPTGYVGPGDFGSDEPVSLEQLRATGLVDRFRVEREAFGDDSDVTYNVGFLVNPGGTFSLGGVYKKGGEFEFSDRERLSQEVSPPPGTGFPIDFDGTNFVLLPLDCNFFTCVNESTTSPFTFETPDVLGVGISWKPAPAWRFAVDAVEVGYSAIEESSILREGQSERIDDEVEFHVGLEYIWFLGGSTDRLFTLRGGGFTDPDHDGSDQIDSDDEHYTIGLGLTLGGFQVDLAGDFSDAADRALISLVYRFS
ncbi:MAG TPA: outer membrane protein transport protein [Thermoanaerobaculia bacterium]|nr:outer membrane protein transport protein [Thermoanaerobaculia bacterium]